MSKSRLRKPLPNSADHFSPRVAAEAFGHDSRHIVRWRPLGRLQCIIDCGAGLSPYASSQTPRRKRSEITPQNTARPTAPKNAVWAPVSSAAAVLTPTGCPRATVPIKVASAATPSAPPNWRAVLASPTPGRHHAGARPMSPRAWP